METLRDDDEEASAVARRRTLTDQLSSAIGASLASNPVCGDGPSTGLADRLAIMDEFVEQMGIRDKIAATRQAAHDDGSGWSALAAGGSLDTTALVRDVDASLRVSGDERVLVLEITLDGDSAQFRHAFGLAPAAPPTVVLDPRYRYLSYSPAGQPCPELALPDPRPTDPQVLQRIGALLGAFTEQYRRLKGREPHFDHTVTEAELVAAEQAMGLRLPEDVRALYLLAGSDLAEIGLLGRYSLMSLDRIVEDQQYAPRFWADLFAGDERVAIEPYPPGILRRLRTSQWWVMIGADGSGGGCAVDLDPAPGGRYGQLFERYATDVPVPLAESATALLTEVVEALRRNDISDYHVSDRSYQDMDYVSANLSPRPTLCRDARELGRRVDDRDLVQLLADHRDLEHVQQIRLYDAELLDLRALSVTPQARTVYVENARLVQLWLPELVESLTLQAQHADLSAIDGHPALWDLTISGLSVEVAQLAQLPALTRLDASGARLDDVAALADLDLRVLVLNGDQWEQIRAAGRVPTTLAGARIAGEQSMARAVEWAQWLNSQDAVTAPDYD
ncbi:SMI1/KNR4 family protein [Nocardia sp. NPDC057030]|uniref:SMI1/KNR4 family protein n=1 Tax=unclassified Nocardia TaxID=2637762 RepID=UPI00362ACCD0